MGRQLLHHAIHHHERNHHHNQGHHLAHHHNNGHHPTEPVYVVDEPIIGAEPVRQHQTPGPDGRLVQPVPGFPVPAPGGYVLYPPGLPVFTDNRAGWSQEEVPPPPPPAEPEDTMNKSNYSELMSDEEYIETHTVTLTEDVYSMAMICSAGYCRTGDSATDCMSSIYIHFLTLVTFTIQAASLIYCIIDKTESSRSINCCSTLMDHPVNVNLFVRLGQWFAVIYSILSLENIICVDTLAFINTLVCGFKYVVFCGCFSKKPSYEYEREKEGCEIGTGNFFAFAAKVVPLTYVFYTGLRISIGLLTLATSIIIVVQSDAVSGVFQDFAALTIIAALDNLVFTTCQMRFLGHRAHRLCVKCGSQEFHAEDVGYAVYCLRITVVLFLVVPFVCVLAIVTTTQQAGAHCPELTLATGVAEVGGLSGLYRWDGGFSNERPVYRQVHPAEPSFPNVVIAHCNAAGAWVVMVIPDLAKDDIQDVCATNWIIASSTDKGYNIFANTGRWIRYTMSFGLVPVAGFSISCTKCEEADEDLQCSRSGTCISDRCACTEGSGFGPICAWAPPCHKVDVQFAKGMWYTEFVKNGPNNLTRVQGAYDIVTLPRCLGKKQKDCVDESPNDFNPDKDMNFKVEWYRQYDKLVSSSLRPIYYNKATEHIMFHDGSRWAITSANRLKFPPNRDNFEQMLQDYFEKFQPWLDSEVMRLGVKLYSDPVSSASPEDANKWASVFYETAASETPTLVNYVELEVTCTLRDSNSD